MSSLDVSILMVSRSRIEGSRFEEGREDGVWSEVSSSGSVSMPSKYAEFLYHHAQDLLVQEKRYDWRESTDTV